MYSTMNSFYAYIFVICSFVICAQSDVPRPRGVSLAKASLYSPTKDFTCFDGTITIPFSYVNDDYCDCFDGSDEPGTSACLNSVFHCTNAGHRPQNIPSSRVNDGLCDCCDGTDEYAQNICTNTCDELGREARAEAQRLAELHKAGSQIREDLIEKGNKKRGEMAEQLSQLEKDKAEAEVIKAEKEALKTEIEARENEALKSYREADEIEQQKKAEIERQNQIREASEHFEKYDSNSDGILSEQEILTEDDFDKNDNGVVDEDEYKYFFNDNLSVDKDTFISSTWQLLKPTLMMKQGMFRPSESNNEEHDGDLNEEEDRDQDTDDLASDDNLDADLPLDDVDDHAESEQAGAGQYDEETQKLVDEATEARRQFSEAERTIREIESNIRNIQQNLEKDYGLHQEYATLDGECFEHEDKEYVYRLCMFQKVTQKSKNGGSEVGLGNWGEWGGGADNQYSIMRYTNGIACWNGPSRMTVVNIHCGLENKIMSVTEPFRCEYRIDLSTPAACDGSNHSQQHASHDEL